MSSLGDFLNNMYKKRELEYKAAAAQSEADLQGAQAIGQGINQIGSSLGGIMKSYSGRMDQIGQGDTALGLMKQQGIDPISQGGIGSMQEFDLRKQMGQFDTSRQLSPYQQLMAADANRRTDVLVGAENRRRQEDLNKNATAANTNASTKYTSGKYDYDAYQADTTANMNQLYQAKTPEQFEMFQKRQKSINFGAMQAGLPEDHLQEIPEKFVPEALQPAQHLFNAQEAFRQGKSQPGDIGRAYQDYETAAPEDTRRFGRGQGEMAPVTSSTGIPKGSFAAKPGFKAPIGFEAQDKAGNKVRWNGQFFAPASESQQ